MLCSTATCDILVVDDDAAIREILVELLAEEGYAVEAAVHGRDALLKLRAGLRPGLIILDWMMPVMSGAQFRQAQHADPLLAAIPVAVISAHASDSLPHDTANAVLRKPIDFARLCGLAAQYCSG